jgi:drug/metabolite transporter (DMT)-like permease
MTLGALGLLLLAAVLHAGWNLLLKQAGERTLAIWWAYVVSAFCALPFILFGPRLPARAWALAAFSAVVEAVYLLTLSAAYRHSDFSVVYPIARGTAPAFLAVWAVLFLGQHPSSTGIAGIIVLVAGLITVGASGRAPAGSARRLPGVALALFVALCISVYSVIDGAAVQFAPALPYTALVFILTTVAAAPVVFISIGGKRPVDEAGNRVSGLRRALDVWRAGWQRIILIGLMSLAAYMLVLVVYSVAPVSYAGAIREVSVVFAALAGWRWLGEGFGVRRVAGSAAIFAGIVIIALA